ncbi:hypothetical protein V1477_020180 [Vespula maculifrons]|uniref:Uncharacterized protein n=1 Tax=Vespula maculifrons TaxID=7453 RepID=A0ABD2AND4_VESMC
MEKFNQFITSSFIALVIRIRIFSVSFPSYQKLSSTFDGTMTNDLIDLEIDVIRFFLVVSVSSTAVVSNLLLYKNVRAIRIVLYINKCNAKRCIHLFRKHHDPIEEFCFISLIYGFT